MGQIWTKIKIDVCKDKRENAAYEVFLTKRPITFLVNGTSEDRYWVIGQYEGEPKIGLTKLASDLREVEEAQRSFSLACFGRRHTDVPPKGAERPAPGGYKKGLKGGPDLQPPDPALIAAMRKDGSETPRRSEQYSVFANYWKKKSLEAHHIVEKSILGTLRYNIGDLRDEIAPSVLVSAELHKLFSDTIATYRTKFTPNMRIERAVEELTRMYSDLYASPEMADLLAIAKIIIDHVERGRLT